MNNSVFYSLLALDAYNRDSVQGVNDLPVGAIGGAIITTNIAAHSVTTRPSWTIAGTFPIGFTDRNGSCFIVDV